jgi:hypothetical protein
VKTFPGWREAGRAMRWARNQDGVTFDRTTMRGTWHYDRLPSIHVDHRWRGSDGREVLISHSSILKSVDVSVSDGRNGWETTYNDDAAQILRLLAALGLIQVDRLNGPMVARLRKCAADTSPNWDGKTTIYPPEARELVALIDGMASRGAPC